MATDWTGPILTALIGIGTIVAAAWQAKIARDARDDARRAGAAAADDREESRRARDDAREAQRAALTSWQEASTALIRANDLTGGMLRAPYAARLEELSAWIIDARRDGQTTEAIRAHVDSWLILTNEAEFVTVERTARKLSRWATHYAQNVLLDSPEDDVKVKRIIGIRLRDWVRDPDAAMKLVREDPLIGNGDVGNIYDDADYRVE